jgi:Neuraminidase (sialidase)
MPAPRTRRTVLATLIVATVLASACTTSDRTGARARVPGAEGKSAEEELAEQAEKTERRLEALEEARLAGTLGVIEPVERDPAPGWTGETILNETGDDWEPAAAADPNGPYVYVLHNRYGGQRACRNCPDPAMILHVSRDGGRTFGRERFLCDCHGVKGQYDPQIEVVPDTGDVYAVWMNDFNISFSASRDHGRTWSDPTPVHPDVRWGDKPILTVSDDGADVYVGFNGPTAGDSYVSSSHDGGATWSAVRTGTGERYYFAYGGDVADDGAVVFTEISFSYTGPDDEAEGQIFVHALVSNDGGTTWRDTIVDALELGVPCTSKSCYPDYYDSGPALTADDDDDLVMVYNGASEPGGPRTVYARASTDHGVTWGDPIRLSRVGVNAAFPAAVGVSDDEVRMWFMDQRTGRWNVRYRRSVDLGSTWTRSVRLSDATSGTAYKTRTGFTEVYGDYGEIVVTSTGDTIAVWGEGSSYFGPGGIWLNREL